MDAAARAGIALRTVTTSRLAARMDAVDSVKSACLPVMENNREATTDAAANVRYAIQTPIQGAVSRTAKTSPPEAVTGAAVYAMNVSPRVMENSRVAMTGVAANAPPATQTPIRTAAFRIAQTRNRAAMMDAAVRAMTVSPRVMENSSVAMMDVAVHAQP